MFVLTVLGWWLLRFLEASIYTAVCLSHILVDRLFLDVLRIYCALSACLGIGS